MKNYTKKIALVTLSMAVATLTACSSNSPASKTEFISMCYDMLDKKDERVYDVCFTEDFWVKGPETVNEPDGKIHGRNAVAGKIAMGGTDLQAYREVEMVTTVIVETDDTIVVNERWVGRGPIAGGYAAMGNPNPPADLEVVNDMIDVYTFRDGKISSQFFQYDTMNFVTTLAENDPKRIADFLQAMASMTPEGGTDFETIVDKK